MKALANQDRLVSLPSWHEALCLHPADVRLGASHLFKDPQLPVVRVSTGSDLGVLATCWLDGCKIQSKPQGVGD